MGLFTERLTSGERFEGAVGRIKPGTPVKLTLEPHNPENARAIAAVVKGVGTIGYVESEWLKTAMIDDGTPVASRVQEIVSVAAGQTSVVVLDVRTGEDAIAALQVSKPQGANAPSDVNRSAAKKPGCGTVLLIGFGTIIGLGVLGSVLPKPANGPSLPTNSAFQQRPGTKIRGAANPAGPAGIESKAAEPKVEASSGRSWWDPMKGVTDKVARDSVDQYNIAAREGDPMQMCVQAGMVAAAFLQAKDEPNYREWKATEKANCRRAGVPR